MNSDIRIAVSFRGHRKRKRLRHLIGDGATDYLIDLWIATAMNHPSGVLEDMDEIDIALEAGWPLDAEGGAEKFVDALLQCKFLEKNVQGKYILHDWHDHQGYVIHAEQRKQQARKAAETRWNKKQVVQGECSQHTSSNPPTQPVPSPEPTPTCSLHKPPPQGALGGTTPIAENSDAYRLAVLMRDTLKANLPTFREPDLQKWAQAFATAMNNDERMSNYDFVAQIISWACSHQFWRGNIQHPNKLHEKFDQLAAKMELELSRSNKTSAPQEWKSPAERRVEANKAAAEEAKRILFGDVDSEKDVAHES